MQKHDENTRAARDEDASCNLSIYFKFISAMVYVLCATREQKNEGGGRNEGKREEQF